MKDQPNIPSSRAEHFRESIAIVNALQLRLQDTKGAKHPLHHWLAAADRVATTLETGQLPGDPDRTLEEDTDLIRFIEATFVPATRLCRLANSLKIATQLGPFARKEVQALALLDDFYHSEYVLHIASKIMATCGLEAKVIDRGSRAAPDLAFPEEQFCIECTARGNERGRSPRKGLASDFDHAGEKFASFLPEYPGWVGVLAVDLGFVGGPTLPNIGRAGPSLDEFSLEVDAGFQHRKEVSMFVGTMISAEASPVGPDTKAGITLKPKEASAWRYASRTGRRLGAIERTFFEWPPAGTVRTIERTRND